jgi:serine protease Do
MRYFTSSGYKQGPNLALYAVIALVSAIIGGVLVLTVAPGYIASRAGIVAQAPAGGGNGGGDNGTGASGPAPVIWTGAWPVTAVAEQIGPSVVGIINQTTYYDWFTGTQRPQESGGSGVVFKRDGQVVYIGTNQHVTGGATKLYVVLADGRRLEAQLVGEDWWTDLAVIKVSDVSLPVARFGDSDLLKPGELVMAVGNPVDMEFQRSVTVGVISGLNRKVSYSDEREFSLIQTDAAINPGNSGGPLVSMSGLVVGINNMKIASDNVEAMGFAIPSNVAQRVLGDLVIYGRVIRAYLGVQIINASDARQYYGLSIEKGIYVRKVIAGSPAVKAGVREGDIILEVDGQETSSLGDLRRVLDLCQPGDEVTVKISRGGQAVSLKATLEEAPDTSD